MDEIQNDDIKYEIEIDRHKGTFKNKSMEVPLS